MLYKDNVTGNVYDIDYGPVPEYYTALTSSFKSEAVAKKPFSMYWLIIGFMFFLYLKQRK